MNHAAHHGHNRHFRKGHGHGIVAPPGPITDAGIGILIDIDIDILLIDIDILMDISSSFCRRSSRVVSKTIHGDPSSESSQVQVSEHVMIVAMLSPVPSVIVVSQPPSTHVSAPSPISNVPEIPPITPVCVWTKTYYR